MTQMANPTRPPEVAVWIVKFVIRGDYTQAGEAILTDEEYAAAEREDCLRAITTEPLAIGRVGRDIREALRLPESGPEFVFVVGAQHYEG
jgi:hypothetical protein